MMMPYDADDHCSTTDNHDDQIDIDDNYFDRDFDTSSRGGSIFETIDPSIELSMSLDDGDSIPLLDFNSRKLEIQHLVSRLRRNLDIQPNTEISLENIRDLIFNRNGFLKQLRIRLQFKRS